MTSAYNWDQFKLAESPKPQTQPSISSFDWNQFPEAKTSTQKGLDEVKRHLTRSAIRSAETLAGLPGDVVNAPYNVAKLAVPKGQEKNFDQVKNIAKYLIPGGNLPTSSDLKDISDKLSGGYTEPQSNVEKKSDDIISDFISLAMPIKGKIPFARSLGTSLAANLAESGVNHLGGEEGSQTATKLGTTFLLTALNPKGAGNYGKGLYKEAQDLLPKNARTDARHLSGELRRFKQELSKGGSAPSKSKALTKIDEILKTSKNGQLSVDELTNFKKTINEARAGLYDEFKTDKVGRASAKRNLDRVSKSIDKALDQYGQTNPAWNKAYRSANEVHGAIEQSKKVSNFVGKVLKQHPHLASSGAVAQMVFAPKTLPLVGLGAAGVKSGEWMARISKSPVLRKYYMNVVNAALKQDSAEVVKDLEKLDSASKSEG